MKKKSTPDYFSRYMAIFSLVISLAAFIFPIFQYYKEQKETTLISIDSMSSNNDVIITDTNFGDEGRVIQFPWNFTISNSGNRKLSITQYNITCGNYLGAMFYSGIKGPLKKINGEIIDLPITLDAGECITGIIYVGVIIPQTNYEILNKIDSKSKIKYIDLMKILAKNGFDIYGNKVIYKEYDNDSYKIVIDEEQQKTPIYWFEFTSGRGEKFIASASTYIGK